ncbi:MAG: sigma-70 family RNA polymerase sigma factor [Prevotella sp.]|nr:sigma-70 family RNA polymerase sigma factor [Prevotella sp.]
MVSSSQQENASLEKYLQEIGGSSLLTPADEQTLCKKAAEGDHDAAGKLVNANLRFVVTVAKRYQNRGLPLQDLVNEGNIGLVMAAHNIKADSKVRFTRHAERFIRQSIEHAIAEQGQLIKMPADRVADLGRITRESRQFEQQNGRWPNVADIASSTGIAHEKVAETLASGRPPLSVDQPIGNANGHNLLDILENSGTPASDNEAEQADVRQETNALTASLDERERNVIRAYYGLGEPAISMAEIGIRHGMKRERVRQIRDKALRKLRKLHRKSHIKTFLDK